MTHVLGAGLVDSGSEGTIAAALVPRRQGDIEGLPGGHGIGDFEFVEFAVGCRCVQCLGDVIRERPPRGALRLACELNEQSGSVSPEFGREREPDPATGLVGGRVVRRRLVVDPESVRLVALVARPTGVSVPSTSMVKSRGCGRGSVPSTSMVTNRSCSPAKSWTPKESGVVSVMTECWRHASFGVTAVPS